MSLRSSFLKASLSMWKENLIRFKHDAYRALSVTNWKISQLISWTRFSTDCCFYTSQESRSITFSCSRVSEHQTISRSITFSVVESASSQVLRQTKFFQFSIHSTFDSASFNQSKHLEHHSIKHLEHQSIKHLEHHSINHLEHHSIKHLSQHSTQQTSLYISAK
jgi:hypothetical protein